MTKMRKVLFPEFRDFLERLGYVEKKTDMATVFKHPEEGLLVFRIYKDHEAVDQRDLLSTRKFFDLRGIMDPADFDAQLLQPASSA